MGKEQKYNIHMDPLKRAGDDMEAVMRQINQVHLDQFELSYEDRLGPDARRIGYERNIQGQGFGERSSEPKT